MADKRGAFVVFEGIDGSGKGTQIKKLKKRLEAEGCSVCRTAEPSDSPIGSLIHQIMIGRIRTSNDVLASLFVADRLDHIQNDVNGLEKFLSQGIHVISDRYYFSSFAYQSVDLPMDYIIRAHEPVMQKLRPDLTVFIDVDPDITMERIETNRLTKELFEEAGRLRETRSRYFEAFERLKDEENVIIVPGDGSPDAIAEEIWTRTRDYFLR